MTPVALEKFTATKNEQHPAGLADSQGARLVVVSETEEGKHLAESRIKLLTGGDPITARSMRQNLFQCSLGTFPLPRVHLGPLGPSKRGQTTGHDGGPLHGRPLRREVVCVPLSRGCSV